MKCIRTLAICLIVLILAVLPLVGAGCSLGPSEQAVPTFVVPPTPTPLIPGSVAVVKKGDITGVVKARARVAAAQEAKLFFKLSGQLKDLKISVGDQVTAGELLAELDAFDLETAVLTAEHELRASNLALARAKIEAQEKASQVELAKVRMEQAEAAMGVAQRNLELARAGEPVPDPKQVPPGRPQDLPRPSSSPVLVAHGALYQASLEYNYWKSNYEVVKKLRDAYNLTLAMAGQEVEYYKLLHQRAVNRQADARLIAPFTGVIVAVDAQPGDKVEPYAPIGAIANPAELAVEATVVEADIDKVAIGQTASVVLDAYPKENFTGKVTKIATKATVWQGKNVYKVNIGFDKAMKVPATIRMGADVRLATQTRQNVLLVPTQAVFTVDRRNYVEVMEEGKRKRVEVEIGLSSEAETEILSGLKEGGMVVIP